MAWYYPSLGWIFPLQFIQPGNFPTDVSRDVFPWWLLIPTSWQSSLSITEGDSLSYSLCPPSNNVSDFMTLPLDQLSTLIPHWFFFSDSNFICPQLSLSQYCIRIIFQTPLIKIHPWLFFLLQWFSTCGSWPFWRLYIRYPAYQLFTL